MLELAQHKTEWMPTRRLHIGKAIYTQANCTKLVTQTDAPKHTHIHTERETVARERTKKSIINKRLAREMVTVTARMVSIYTLYSWFEVRDFIISIHKHHSETGIALVVPYAIRNNCRCNFRYFSFVSIFVVLCCAVLCCAVLGCIV